MGAGKRPVIALVTGIVEYQLRVIAGMAQDLAQRDIPLLVVADEPFASDSTPSVVLELIRRRIPCGAVAFADVSQFRRSDLSDALLAARMPLVTLGSQFGTAPSILADNARGMRQLMAHLLDDSGVRRPLLVRGVRGNNDSEEREKVFREEMAARGLTVDEDAVLTGEFRLNDAYDAVAEYITDRGRPEAVVALNDSMALGVLSALTDHGYRVPDDVLVTGFDNIDVATLSWPGLTTVDQDLEEQGRRAVELVVQMGDGAPHEKEVVVPSRLVVRASTTVDRGVALSSEDPAELAKMPGACEIEGKLLFEATTVAGEFARIAATARALQNRNGLQDAALNLAFITSNCRTVDELMAGLDPALKRLGMQRCFLAVDCPPPAHAADDGQAAGTWVKLVLSFRDGTSQPVDEEAFLQHELLPESLRDELDRGVLLLQALSVAGRERGHLLYEPIPTSSMLTEAVRIDLPRAVDTVLSSREMADHAAMLERVVAERTRELERANAELHRSVLRDGLTGIANRKAFQQLLEECWSGAGATDLALLMIDVDMFKPFNDRYGHLAGDAALQAVATCLASSVREPQDLACRYGGEEFAVVLRGAGQERALTVAERIRQNLSAAAIRHEASTVSDVVTVSIGIAAVRIGIQVPGTAPMDGPSDLIASADEALYRAKLTGRDRVVCAGPTPGPVRMVPAPR